MTTRRRMLQAMALAPLAACGLLPGASAARGILFADGDRLLWIDPDAGDRAPKALVTSQGTGSLLDPAWSPDGKQIVLSHTPVPGDKETFGADLQVLSADGSQRRTVFRHDVDGGLARAPVWSRDGGSLLFVYAFDRPVAGGARFETVQQIERLVLATGARTVLVPGGDLPAVAPTGDRLAYVKLPPPSVTVPAPGSSTYPSLWLAAIDGSAPRPLVDLPSFEAMAGPRFSPDGATLVFGAAGGRDSPPRFATRWKREVGASWWMPAVAAHGVPLDLWRVEVASGRLERLAPLGADDLVCAWAPDGRRLVLQSSLGLALFDLSNGALQPLVSQAGFGNLDWLASAAGA